MNDPMLPIEYVRMARSLCALAELDDLPCSSIQPILRPHGDQGMQVGWQVGNRAVVVTITGKVRMLECRTGDRWHGHVDLSRGGVGSFRDAIGWLMGQVDRPPGDGP